MFHAGEELYSGKWLADFQSLDKCLAFWGFAVPRAPESWESQCRTFFLYSLEIDFVIA